MLPDKNETTETRLDFGGNYSTDLHNLCGLKKHLEHVVMDRT